MRKNSYIFTAILAIVVSTGAWASTPTAKEAQDGTSHPVYTNAPIDGEASEGIAGVTYVNRVANRAGAAAQAAENHAAHASKSAYDAATAASNAQASADIAAAVINNLQAGDGVTVADVMSADGKSTVGKKVSAKISDGLEFVASGDNKGAIAVNMGAGLKADTGGAVAINEGVGLKLEGDVLVPNLAGGDSVTITQGTGDDKDKLVISANTPTATTPGVVKMPTYTEVQRMLGVENPELPPYGSESEEGRQMGLSVETFINSELARTITMQEEADKGAFSGAYSTTEEMPDLIPSNYEELQSRPLSAYAYIESQIIGRKEDATVYAVMPETDADESHAVGDSARPVYLQDQTVDGKHRGVVTPIDSVAIPVGSENFAETITSANVAKIWIQ